MKLIYIADMEWTFSDLCSGNVFVCTNATRLQCVERNFVCDGVSDCQDGSDEFNCTGKICLTFNMTYMLGGVVKLN